MDDALRSLPVAAALALGVTVASLAVTPSARAQATSATITAVQQVNQLAPQLVPFAGSAANFESLVNGLTFGAPVVLTTPGADGLLGTVTFTPAGGLAPVEVARTLERARQQLISQGIGSPNGEQIGVMLAGSAVQSLPAPATRASAPALSTSASPFFGTSDTPVLGTSASPVVGTSVTPLLPNATTLPAPGAASGARVRIAPGTLGAATGAGGAGVTIRPGAAAALPGAAGTAIAPNGPPSPAAQIQSRR